MCEEGKPADDEGRGGDVEPLEGNLDRESPLLCFCIFHRSGRSWEKGGGFFRCHVPVVGFTGRLAPLHQTATTFLAELV